jgi:hypothetical protein
MENSVEVYEGSANIFADLGLPDADAHLLKAQIVSEVFRLSNDQKIDASQSGETSRHQSA